MNEENKPAIKSPKLFLLPAGVLCIFVLAVLIPKLFIQSKASPELQECAELESSLMLDNPSQRLLNMNVVVANNTPTKANVYTLFGIKYKSIDVSCGKALKKTQEAIVQPPIYSIEEWPAYINTKYGYSFKHPRGSVVAVPGPSLSSVKESDSVIIYRSEEQNGIALQIEVREPIKENWPGVDEMNKLRSLPVKEYANHIWENNKYDNNPNMFNKQVSDLEEFTMDGNPAYKFTLTESYHGDDVMGGYSLGDEKFTYVITGKNEVKYQIWFPSNDSLWTTVVSTWNVD